MTLPARIAWALELLSPTPGERVLEIGCGSGVAAAELVRAGCEVTALDRSAKAIAATAARLGGATRLICADLENAELAAGGADAVLSINVNLFWTTPGGGLAALRHALSPNGRMVLVFDPPSAEQAATIGARLAGGMRAAGLACELRRGEGRLLAALART